MDTSQFKFMPHAAYIIVAIMLLLHVNLQAGEPLDTLIFGSADSERGHSLTAQRSDVIAGGLGESARRLLPLEPQSWEGGSTAFTLKVDPHQRTYVTLRLWGSDLNENRLILFCEGRQVGYRHLGDIDILDSAKKENGPPLSGRFYYATTPLPIEMTAGKTSLHFEIRSTGRIWDYGTTFDEYQKPMTVPTRGMYRVYSHVGGYFVPPATQKEGLAVTNPPVTSGGGHELLDAVRKRVSGEVKAELGRKDPLDQHRLWTLAKAYHVKWTPAYQNPLVAEKAVRALDALYVDYHKNPKLAQEGPAIYNAGWFGLGPAASAVVLLSDSLKPSLDGEISGAAGICAERDGLRCLWRAGIGTVKIADSTPTSR